MEVGSLAIVDVNGESYELVVTAMESPTRIRAGNYTLVQINGVWQVEGYSIPHNVSPLTMERAVRSDRLDQVIRLSQTGVPLNHRVADLAAEVGSTEILDWLTGKGIDPTPMGIARALGNGHYKVVNWALNQGFNIINQRVANVMASQGNIRALEFLQSRGVLPDETGALAAELGGKPEVVRWLQARGVYPPL